MTAPLTRWNREDLLRRLCHALDIAEHAIERLAGDGYTDPHQPGNSVRPEKVISETGLLLLVASEATDHAEVKVRIDQVARLLIPYARGRRMLLGVCLQPALALDYAYAHVCLSRLGYPHKEFNELLRQSRRSQAAAGCERLPYRLLEQQWIADLSGCPEAVSRRRAGATVTRSALACSMDLLNGHRDDVYAFTHALMYSSRFNSRPRRSPRSRRTILAEAEGMLARCLDDEDYDLAGELLLAWPLTGKSWSATATFGFRVLSRVEDVAGFLPAPNTRLDRVNALKNNERATYLLATAYHTAYVMGLLCAAALQLGRSPSLEIHARGPSRGAASQILKHLDTDGPVPHWRTELNTLTDPERDAIAGFLLDVALRRTVARHDFNGARRLLALGSAWNLANSPVSSQVAEMLGRLALAADLLSSA